MGGGKEVVVWCEGGGIWGIMEGIEMPEACGGGGGTSFPLLRT